MAETLEIIHLLVVTQDAARLHELWPVAQTNSWSIATARNCWDAMERLQSQWCPRVVILDLAPGAGHDLQLLPWLRRLRPEISFVVTCHPEDAVNADSAIRFGAVTVLVRPFGEHQLEAAIHAALSGPGTSIAPDLPGDIDETLVEDDFFLDASPVMHKIRAQAELLAHSDVPVLVVGEPGTGKVMVARLIHKLSVRSGFSFHRLDCGAVPGPILESKLFGARANSRFESRAHLGMLHFEEHGTLLLENISRMRSDAQLQLAEYFQQKLASGDANRKSLNPGPRIVAASSDSLEEAVSQKRFREDLFHHLTAFTIHVPALRQRKDDIPALLGYAMHRLSRRYGLAATEFSKDATAKCVAYSWPGNLREMEDFVKRYLIAGNDELVAGESSGAFSGSLDLPEGREESLVAKTPVRSQKDVPDSTMSLKALIENVKSDAERNAITAALQKTRWNRKAAARLLRVSYRTLLYKIERYQMSSSDSGFEMYSARPDAKEIVRTRKAI